MNREEEGVNGGHLTLNGALVRFIFVRNHQVQHFLCAAVTESHTDEVEPTLALEAELTLTLFHNQGFHTFRIAFGVAYGVVARNLIDVRTVVNGLYEL